MKNLILQVGIFDPERSTPEFLENKECILDGARSLAEYAERIGADYMLADTTMGYDAHIYAYKSLHLFINEKLDDYDYVWMLDIDSVAGYKTPDIFSTIDTSYDIQTAWQDNYGTGHMDDARYPAGFFGTLENFDPGCNWKKNWIRNPNGNWLWCGGGSHIVSKDFRVSNRENAKKLIRDINESGLTHIFSDEPFFNYILNQSYHIIDYRVNFEKAGSIFLWCKTHYASDKVTTVTRATKHTMKDIMNAYEADKLK